MTHATDLAEALADRNELGEPLGAGGMASVYRALDRKHEFGICDLLAAGLALVGESERGIEWMRRSSLVRGWIDYPFWSEQDRLVSRLAPHPEYQSVLREIEVRWQAALATGTPGPP